MSSCAATTWWDCHCSTSPPATVHYPPTLLLQQDIGGGDKKEVGDGDCGSLVNCAQFNVGEADSNGVVDELEQNPTTHTNRRPSIRQGRPPGLGGGHPFGRAAMNQEQWVPRCTIRGPQRPPPHSAMAWTLVPLTSSDANIASGSLAIVIVHGDDETKLTKKMETMHHHCNCCGSHHCHWRRP